MGEDGLRVQVARLEERMNTMQAEYKTDIARLAEQLAERDARLAERDARMAERDSRLLQWMVGIAVAGVAVLGLLIRL